MEYAHEGCAIRASSQIQVEHAVMVENLKRFVLACSSPLLQRDWLVKLGIMGEKEAS